MKPSRQARATFARLVPLLRLPLLLLPLLLLPLLLAGTGCTTLGALAALDQVELSFDSVSGGSLAGVDLTRYRSLSEVPTRDLLQIGLAYRQGDLPLRFTAHVGAKNPNTNAVTARLERLGWTLRLNGRNALNGIVDRPVVLPAGQRVDVPIGVEVDLLDLYSDNRDDLVQLALRLVGRGGDPQNVELAVRPTVSTPLGPITYPGDIVLTRRDI